MSNSKNDIAWGEIFEKHKILDRILKDGHIEITATKINEFREARLMTKFDHKSQLPKLFADHKLSILPTSRGGYVIGEFETFFSFNTDEIEVTSIEFPTFLESIDYREITSEATAINCAFVAKILHNFTEEDNLLPTVSGRMSSSSFKFGINSPKGLFNVNVGNSQVEIDGGYEGDNSLNLIEAKNYISDDFLVRQLYYPFKLWSGKIKKQVRPIFLTYSNGVFHLREYSFSNVNHYNSLVLVKHRKYVVQEGSFNLEALSQIIDETKTTKEPEIPFPQADSFERVINLCELLKQKEFITKEEITQNYDFDTRQTDYYSNAGKYLGLIDTGRDPLTGQTGCFLTRKGKQVFGLNIIDRQKEFVKLIVSHKVFKETLKLHLDNGEIPDKGVIVEIMKRYKLHNVGSDSTYFRRASTIIGWTNWIINQTEE
ncbi:MAG: transcriptional regulator [Bacteroidia bacterium]|nr:transcriptional regulator [Bacteroidia bacterium]MBP7260368.1 transcriptional regulator [Bacteroidia bacterium]MBP9180181.1 transcriptional regulator [Bacteroidia bacterium]MBP9724258.1 transcriptional regulator [Bacteroidia bacterium]